MRTYRLGRLFGLQVSGTPLALVGTLLLWLLVGTAARGALALPLAQAAWAGLLGAALWWLIELVHQLGHAVTARGTGHPMAGIEFGQFALFARSIYPADEPDLPASVHIRRALGGPVASLALGAAAGLTALLLPAHGPAWWAALYTAAVSTLVMGLGALLPLGFTDGSTLLAWWGRR